MGNVEILQSRRGRNEQGRGVKLVAASLGSAAAGAALFGGGAAFDSLVLHRGEETTVSGVIECLSGRPVVGAWIQAQDGSGWANRKVVSSKGDVVVFWRDLPHAESYAVHTGCGGSPDNWASRNYSPFVDSSEHPIFACQDEKSTATLAGPIGVCAVASG